MGLIHKWERYSVKGGTAYEAVAGEAMTRTVTNQTVYYCSSITVDQNTGTITFNDPAQITISVTNASELIGKYINRLYSYEANNYSGLTEVYKVESRNTPLTYAVLDMTVYTVQLVDASVKGTYIGRVTSSDQNAYPTDGVGDGYWYVYIGSEEVTSGIFATIDGVQKELTAIPAMVDGVPRELSEVFATVDGVARAVFSAGLLPRGYTLFSYIEGTGQQYIDTGYVANANTVIRCKFSNLSLDKSGDFALLGSAWGNYSVLYSATTAIRWYAGSSTTIGVNENGVNEIEITANSITANGATNTVNALGTYPTTNVWLLGTGDNGASTAWRGRCKIYSVQILEGETLIRDFVPCKDPSGAYGLYDLANGAFYGNAGTGSFTGG